MRERFFDNKERVEFEFRRFRNKASNFTKKSEVRNFIFSRDDYKCVACNSESELQIDHIKSVYWTFYYGSDSDKDNINSYDNLQTLCKKCNCSKAP